MSLRDQFQLDPSITFLNHGSFGACPRVVTEFQRALQDELEREPVTFLVRRLEPRLDAVRERLAPFLGAQPEDLAFVPNTTTAVNSVVRSWPLRPGDAVLTTDHAYNACRNALDRAAADAGAEVIVVAVPFPLRSEDEVVDALAAAITPSVRYALLDHVTSPTGLVLPLERMVATLHARGVDVLVDGAHAPGMVALELDRLRIGWYAGNLHKWVCAPKGSAFLHVRRDRQDATRPAITSHGANARRKDRSRFLLEFDWPGTVDPSPWLAVPVALDAMAAMVPGGWSEVRARNHALALYARDVLCAALGTDAPAPDGMIGALATVPLPPAGPDERPGFAGLMPTQERLYEQHHIEVPVFGWPRLPQRALRISAQLYNERADYDRLASVLREMVSTTSEESR